MSKPRKRGLEVGDLITGIEQAPLAGAPSPKVSMGLRDASPLRSPICRHRRRRVTFWCQSFARNGFDDRGLASAGMRD
jgi:hypothetical protein